MQCQCRTSRNRLCRYPANYQFKGGFYQGEYICNFHAKYFARNNLSLIPCTAESFRYSVTIEEKSHVGTIYARSSQRAMGKLKIQFPGWRRISISEE